MIRVLVTGATGVIGRAAVPILLASGHEVTTTSRRSSGGRGHVVADLTDRGQVDQLLRRSDPQAVLHLAGGAAPSAAALVRTNLDATSTLLHALAARPEPLRRLVVTGSAAEYGEGDGSPIREDHPAAPVGAYGRVKLAQRLLVQLMAQDVASSTVLARPFNVVSPGLAATTPLGNLRRQLALVEEGARVEVACGRLDLVRDFLSVTAVAQALVGLLTLKGAPGAINLCSGRATVLGDLFDSVARLSGRRAVFVVDETLGKLPAAASVVGDPRLVTSLGLVEPEAVDVLAAALLEGLSPVRGADS